MVYKATFNLPERYTYTGAIKGTGKTLGLMGGNGNSTLYQAPNNPTGLTGNVFNADIGTSYNYSTNVYGTFGITTDASKSGMVCEKDSMNVCIKY